MKGVHSMSQERFYLYDEIEETETRYVSFLGEHERFDIGIVKTNRFFGKSLVFNIQSNRFAIIGNDDLDEPGCLEAVFQLNEKEANELRAFLREALSD